jgi:hypothetical protein
MIWLTWRQHRRQTLFTVVALAALAALMVPTGLAMHRAFVHYGLSDCLRGTGHAGPVPDMSAACTAAVNRFNHQYQTLGVVGALFIFLPLLVGLFWGAPLVAREVEHGTHRLVWTQGVSRRHWALVKFGFVGTATLAIAVGYGLGMSWWLTPMARTGLAPRFGPVAFDVQGVAPIGYTVFAVALGVFAGTVWRKVLPAMAVTLVGFLGVRIALTVLARPRFLPPRTLTYPVRSTGLQPNITPDNWVVANGVRDASGKLVAANAEILCPPDAQGPGSGCGADLGIGPGAYNWQLYQPGSRYWLFQGIETGIFVALAAVLLYLAVRRIRRIA